MRCPHCGTVEDKVIESRTLANGDAIRRRRECISCSYRFTSYERIIDEKQLMVVKRDGKREPFERDKLERGVVRAMEKRPFSQLQIESLINEIEDEAAISSKGSREIFSSVIGNQVLTKLGELDKVAYIRFASVYKQFGNLEEFIEEIKKVGEEQNSTHVS